MKKNRRKNENADEMFERAIINRMIDNHIEKTISDQQAHRVLEPVRDMINLGKFDKPRRSFGTVSIVQLVSAAAVLLVVFLLARETPLFQMNTELITEQVPLAQSTPIMNSISGRVTIGESRVGVVGVMVTLVHAQTMETTATAITDDNGRYIFRHIPTGTYLLAVTPHTGMEVTADMLVDGWIGIDGDPKFVFGEGVREHQITADIQLHLTED